ncbi:MAG TPA: hypothetical protein PKD53_11705 [Chloroflexaceae bacterium]|nr:hypothetical protein [Chloroflexaceae bacterium]
MSGPIDLPTVAIMFLAGLVAIGLTLWMLNRAWGNFPSRMGPGDGLPPTPLSQGPASRHQAAPADDEDEDDEDDALPAGAPAEGLVEVTHPMVLRAVRQSMERPGSPYSTYFIADGERVFLALHRIADPDDREAARRAFQGLNSGDVGGIDLIELMRAIGRLGK